MNKGVLPGSYHPQNTLFLWMLVNPEHPTLVGELGLSQLVVVVKFFRTLQ